MEPHVGPNKKMKSDKMDIEIDQTMINNKILCMEDEHQRMIQRIKTLEDENRKCKERITVLEWR